MIEKKEGDKSMKTLSIVVPCLNEEQALPLFYKDVRKVCQTISGDYEFWFVDDGSTDGTLQLIKKFRSKDKSVHYISFSRNFGKEAAMYAGLQATTGEYVAVMDADLQDPPSLLSKMYQLIQQGQYDCVCAKRLNRSGEKKFKSFFSHVFYNIMNMVSDVKLVSNVRDFRMMTRQMVNAVLSLSEYQRFSKGIFSWVGFQTKYIGYYNIPRIAGSTSWSFTQLARYAVDGLMDFSEVPLSIAIWLGFFSAILAFLGLVIVVVRHFIIPTASAFGWSSLVCIVLFLSGVQLWFTGILGKYIGKIYIQGKHRPIYIVKEKH